MISAVDDLVIEALFASHLQPSQAPTAAAIEAAVEQMILRLGSSLSVGFEQIILQQGPVGLEASEVLDTWVYNNGIIGGDWGISAAVGLVKSVIGLLLVIGANKLAHMFGERGVYERR